MNQTNNNEQRIAGARAIYTNLVDTFKENDFHVEGDKFRLCNGMWNSSINMILTQTKYDDTIILADKVIDITRNIGLDSGIILIHPYNRTTITMLGCQPSLDLCKDVFNYAGASTMNEYIQDKLGSFTKKDIEFLEISGITTHRNGFKLRLMEKVTLEKHKDLYKTYLSGEYSIYSSK